MHTLAIAAGYILVTSTIPALQTRRPDVRGDHSYSWTEPGTLEELITARDPFQDPDERTCGRIRPLGEQGAMLAQLDDPMAIHDDVVLDYWESRDDNVWWTPLCSARHDYVGVGR
jgi:hypothetical protein